MTCYINEAVEEQRLTLYITVFILYIQSKRAASATFRRLTGRNVTPGVCVCVCVEGCVLASAAVCLFSALNQLGNVQVCCYVIFTSFSVRSGLEPVWRLTGSFTVAAEGCSAEHLCQVQSSGGRTQCGGGLCVGHQLSLIMIYFLLSAQPGNTIQPGVWSIHDFVKLGEMHLKIHELGTVFLLSKWK